MIQSTAQGGFEPSENVITPKSDYKLYKFIAHQTQTSTAFRLKDVFPSLAFPSSTLMKLPSSTGRAAGLLGDAAPGPHRPGSHRAGITPRRVTDPGSHRPSRAGAGPEKLPKGTLENRSLESTWSHRHLLSSSRLAHHSCPRDPRCSEQSQLQVHCISSASLLNTTLNTGKQ